MEGLMTVMHDISDGEKIVAEKSLTTSLDDEVVIDESNFDSYFFDVRMNKPQHGQVMARYRAVADFVDGRLKKDIIDLIYNKDKAEAATRVLQKLGCATERDSIRVCKEIAVDFIMGMTPEQVENKVYNFVVEVFYYTMAEYVPKDDPHWSIINLHNLDEFLDGADQKFTITARIVGDEALNGEESA
jgi:hypothetical protein